MITSSSNELDNNRTSLRVSLLSIFLLISHVIAHSNENWTKILFYLQIESNNVKQFIIEYISNELTYDFKISDFVNILVDFSSQDYDKLRLVKRKNVEIIMTFVNVISKTRYDNKHKTLNDNIQSKFIIYLRLY